MWEGGGVARGRKKEMGYKGTASVCATGVLHRTEDQLISSLSFLTLTPLLINA